VIRYTSPKFRTTGAKGGQIPTSGEASAGKETRERGRRGRTSALGGKNARRRTAVAGTVPDKETVEGGRGHARPAGERPAAGGGAQPKKGKKIRPKTANLNSEQAHK